jgi:uncharacterized membrane protein (UPF0127 family)
MVAMALAAVVLELACGGSKGIDSALNTRELTLPNGIKIQCEVMIRPEDQARGMMYRDELPPDRGMLFLHFQPGNRPYWMHNVKIPLDIIWLDATNRIVEISANTPPCLKPPEQCPGYGGKVESTTVRQSTVSKLGTVCNFEPFCAV